MSKVIYSNLIAEMARKKITQKKLGEMLGLTNVAIHQRLYGTTEWKLSEICYLMNYFKLDFDYLFERKN